VSRDVQTEDEVKTEVEEASPSERRVMRIVLWGIVAVMAVAWVFLFYNVASRTLFPPPAPVPAKPAEPPAKPAAPSAVKPAAAAASPAAAPPVMLDGGTSGPSISIETPADGAVVSQPFVFSGWAIDRSAPDGTGVSGGVVLALPIGGGENRVAGMVDYGSDRPDLGQSLGPRFQKSGFSLNVTNLPSGQWKLAIFPRSTQTNDFMREAIAVTITVR
jgi:hypothetical protein